jgi:hypothetical protein
MRNRKAATFSPIGPLPGGPVAILTVSGADDFDHDICVNLRTEGANSEMWCSRNDLNAFLSELESMTRMNFSPGNRSRFGWGNPYIEYRFYGKSQGHNRKPATACFMPGRPTNGSLRWLLSLISKPKKRFFRCVRAFGSLADKRIGSFAMVGAVLLGDSRYSPKQPIIVVSYRKNIRMKFIHVEFRCNQSIGFACTNFDAIKDFMKSVDAANLLLD